MTQEQRIPGLVPGRESGADAVRRACEEEEVDDPGTRGQARRRDGRGRRGEWTSAMLDWRQIDWRCAEQDVRRLRQRIFMASKAGDLPRVRRLQKLMLRPRQHADQRAAGDRAQRRSSDRGRGRRGRADPEGQSRAGLRGARSRGRVQGHAGQTGVHPQAVPNSNAHSDPVLIDRCHQAQVLNALEPEWEARFEPKSYGFRPGRGCHDAIEAIFQVAKQNPRRLWVLDADLAGALLGTFPTRGMIRQWLKAGVVEHGRLSRTEEAPLRAE
jgi:RNA-directed DNA polymerase